MLVKVLTSDPATASYFVEVPDDQDGAFTEFQRIVHGDLERITTPQLDSTFGTEPRVVMMVNRNGNIPGIQLPPNAKASKFYPNDFGVEITGEAILVGEVDIWTDGEPDYTFVSIPEKWKILYDMETLACKYGDDYEALHSGLDDLLLKVADPDVAKYYQELRDTARRWPTA
jgi:hypothetical protein